MTDITYNEHDDVELTYDPRVSNVTHEILRQMLAFDIVPDDILLAHPVRLGLNPVSEDVWHAEQQGSQQRRNNIGPVLPVLHILSRLSFEVIKESILVREESDPTVDLTLDASRILSASVGIVATLVDLGLLHLPVHEITTETHE